jgi:hypothetical protein
MNCIITDFKVKNDFDNVIKKLINRVSKSNTEEAIKILTYFDEVSNTDFRQFVLDNLVDSNKEKYEIKSISDLTNEKLANINQNVLESLIRTYYVKMNPNGVLTVRKNDYTGLNGFTSFNARNIAKAYTATKIIKAYDSGSVNEKNPLAKIVGKMLSDEFEANYLQQFLNIVIENENKQFNINNINTAKELINIINEIKSISDRYNSLRKQKYITKEEDAFIKETPEKIKALKAEKKRKIQVLFKSVPANDYSKYVNMFNLWEQVTFNTLDWFRQVQHIKTLANVFKKFDKELNDYEKLDEYIDFDEDDDVVPGNEDSIDNYAKNWADQMLKSFDQQISEKIKVYLNSIPVYKIEKDADGKSKYSPDTNNELGVTIPMDGRYLLTQLSTRCNFASPEAFVDSLRKISTIPSLYGVAKIVEDVTNNELLLNELFVELNNYAIDKVQINVEGDNVNSRLSNATKDTRTNFLFKFRTGIINTYKYISKDALLDSYYAIGMKQDNNIEIRINNLRNYIKNKLNIQFPTINNEEIEELFKRISEKDLIILANNIKKFDSAINIAKENYRKASDINKKNKQIIEEAAMFGDYDVKLENPNPFADIDVNSTFTNEALINIADIFSKYVSQGVQLNHYNASGNLSTDLITQNAITNLMKQISYTELTEDGKINYVGLKKLRDFCLKCPSYAKNTFLFGIKDKNGNVVQQGIFDADGYNNFLDKENNGLNAHINPKARQMIEVALFDGVKNNNENNSGTYNKLSRGDYFVSLLHLYGLTNDKGKSSVKFYRGSDVNDLKGFALPTPSDAPKQFIIFLKSISTADLFNKTSASVNGVNTKSKMFLALRQILVQEIKDFYKGLNDITDDNGIGYTSVDGLFENYHYGKKGLFDGKRLTGHVFNFTHLPSLNNYDLNEAVLQLLNVYDNKDSLITLTKDKKNFQVNKDALNFNEYDERIEKGIDEIVANWINDYYDYVSKNAQQYKHLINKENTNNIYEFAFNNVIQLNNFDDLFTGDSKFYKNTDDQFKRFKEVQAGGKQTNAYSIADNMDTFSKDDNFDIAERYLNDDDFEYKRYTKDSEGNLKRYTIKKQNGFRAITIANNITDAMVKDIKEELYKTIFEETGNADLAERQSSFIADKYKGIKADDAQSYITLEEFIRRRYNDGTLNKYKNIIKKLQSLPVRADGSYDISKLTKDELDSFIQVQKNFYYDITFDENLQMPVPRQIKNGEFVLIPELLPKNSPLKKLYDFMIKHDINQINTKEADKAGKKNVLTLFDENGNFIDEEEADRLVENYKSNEVYFYKNLYRQQEIVSHLKDKENKIGLQFARKILDNIDEKLKPFADKFQQAYANNIALSKEELFKEMGWSDEQFAKGNIDLTKYYERAEKSGVTLGMNVNYYDFVTLSSNGAPIMDNDLSSASSKLESIALSVFNSAINRQTIPGFHVTQIAGDKFRKTDGTTLQYHPKDENGERQPYMEILIPRNSYNIPKTITYTDENGIIRQRDFLPSDLPEELQEIILYRIPTEGKQSMTIGKIVGFLDDIYDSTIVVPKEWIAQTGSDNDGDSVYAIQHKIISKSEKDGSFTIKAADKTQRDKNNSDIIESAKAILKDRSSREENYLSSNFQEIANEIEAIEKPKASSYDIFTQVNKMDNAMSGANLKGISVFRDSFTSLCNAGKAIINSKNAIDIIYKIDKNVDYKTRVEELKARFGEENVIELSNNKVKITHNMLGWSYDNRNVDGHLITAYSSQTTAHILDAIKSSTIPNENEYTFGAFKTLVDIGTNYKTAIAFLTQPAITYINEEVAASNSLYGKTFQAIVPNAIKRVLINGGIVINGEEINQYTRKDVVINYLTSDEEFKNAFANLLGVKEESVISELQKLFDGKQEEGSVTINQELLERRKQVNGNNKTVMAYDILNILQFNLLKQTSNRLERLNRLSRVDKVGAQATIFETRDKILDIEDELNARSQSILTAVNSINERENFINALYGEHSFYPYLKAYYENATIPAVKLGERIFSTERNEFNKLYNFIAEKLGIPLDKNLQKLIKSYYIANIFNYIPELTQPLITTKYGVIIPNERATKEYESNGNDATISELHRIYGYNITNDVQFTIKDKTNPTEEELYQFSLLSSAQKVLVLQREFNNDSLIFKHLNAIITNESNLKYKGYSINTIRYTDDVRDQDELIWEFQQAYFNQNPLFKLAAIDLIKYAYIVDGLRYKAGGLTKILPNAALLNLAFNGQENIIEKFTDIKNNMVEGLSKIGDNNIIESADIEDLIDKFARANSNLVRTYAFKRENKKDKNGKIIKTDNGVNVRIESKEEKTFIKCRTKDGLVTIPKLDENKDLINNLSSSTYVKVINSNKEKTSTLYKIEEDENNLYLIPRPLLEANETNNISINPNNNNKFYPIDYYYDVIYGTPREDAAKQYNQYKKDKIKLQNATIKNEDDLINLSKNNTSIGNESRAFLNKITNAILNSQNSNYSVKITFGGYNISKLFEDGNYVTQIIPFNEGNVITNIRKVNKVLSKAAWRYFRNHDSISDYETRRYNEEQRSFANTLLDSDIEILKLIYSDKANYGTETIKGDDGISRTTNKIKISVYEIQLLGEDIQSSEENIENDENEERATRVSSSNIGTGSIRTNNRRRNSSHFTGGVIQDSEMAKTIINDVVKYGKPQFANEIERFKRQINKLGADINSDEDLERIKLQVFLNAKRYYNRIADIMWDNLNNFKLTNGDVYSLADPELYKHINKDSNDYERLIQTILDAYTFGNTFGNKLNLYVSDDNVYVQDAINSIRNSIHKIKDNTIIHNAIQNIFNIYFADKYSNNPIMKLGIGKLTDTFGDADKLTFLFADVAETNNQLIQVISKYIQSSTMGAEIVDAPAAIKIYRERIKSIIGDNKELFKKIIKNGKIVQDYNELLIKDLDKQKADLDVTKVKYGISSIEYFKQKLEYDKFMNSHFQLPVKKGYYDETIAAKETVLANAPTLFAEYNALRSQTYDTTYQLPNDEEEIRRVEGLNAKILQLLSPIDITTHKRKSKEELNEIAAIHQYNKDMAIISKKYYEEEADNDFESTLAKYKEIIDKYNATHVGETLETKLLNSDFKSAYDWIKTNSITKFSNEALKEINNAFSLLRRTAVGNDILDLNLSVLDELLMTGDRYDKQHIIDGRKFTVEEKQKLIDEYNKQFENDYDSTEADASLIRDVPKSDEVYKSSFYDLFNAKLNPDTKKEKQRIIKEINAILRKGIDEAGHIDTNTLFDNCTKEELIKLGDLYEELRNIKNPKKSTSRVFAIEANAKFKVNSSEYDYQKVQAITRFTNKDGKLDKEMFNIWSRIFSDYEYKDGIYVPVNNKKTGKPVANNELYGYIEPKDKDKFIDKDKTNARKLVSEEITFVPTEYYYDAEKAARKEGRYAEWYEENHVFNPYTHRYEPLRIWTVMTPTIGGKFDNDNSYRTSAAGEYSHKKIKEDEINPEYNKDVISYRRGDSRYDSNVILDNKERELRDYVNEIMRTFYKGTKYKDFIRQGNAPRRYKENINLKYVGKQALGIVGATVNMREKEWTDELSYNTDFETTFNMLEEIKTKAYVPLPKKPINPTAEELQTYYDELAKAKEVNAKTEQDFISDNWYEIFEDFIKQSVARNNQESLKNTGYLLLEYLRNNPAYRTNYRGNVKLDKSSTEYNPVAATRSQDKYYDMYETWLRRILFNQFKENSKLRPWADMLQNMASAKYMMINVTGGIANVTTGFVNILGEEFSNMYWSKKDYHKALSDYRNAIPALLRDMYKETSVNRYAAIMKRFKIVDFTNITERKEDETVSEYTKRIREHLYDLQNGGEHMMQNIAMLSLLNSNRLYKNLNGEYTIGDVNNYTQYLEEVALRQFLENDAELLRQFELFKREVAADVNKRKKYEEFTSNLIRDFFKEYGINKDDIKKYIEIRDKLIKEKKDEFYKFKTLDSYIYHDNKTGEITFAEQFDEKLIGEFKNKAFSLNKKIHGVYDKIGAANIEKYWYGGIIMQYHKHIYPGIMKRWRIKGLFNEHRNSIEQGSYISLAKFLTTDIRAAIQELKDKKINDEEITAIESIQTIGKSILDTFANAKFNWEFMNQWEKQNCLRCIGDLCGVVSAILIAIGLYAFTDDDDIKESNFLATVVYLSDRLYQESRMYTIGGVINEGKTLWSSPIASEKLIEDLVSSMGIIVNYMSNPDFNINYTTGMYKGENKLWVKLRRNIPIYRVYDRLSRMTKNNNYYKIGSNNNNMKLAKYVANFINPEE